jgi:hypothetical protein
MKENDQAWLAAYSVAYAILLFQHGSTRNVEEIDTWAKKHADRVAKTVAERETRGKGK